MITESTEMDQDVSENTKRCMEEDTFYVQEDALRDELRRRRDIHKQNQYPRNRNI